MLLSLKKKKQQPSIAIIAKYIATFSLLCDILNEPPIVAANISNIKANKAVPPMNLATTLDNLFKRGMNTDKESNKLNNTKATIQSPTPKTLEP